MVTVICSVRCCLQDIKAPSAVSPQVRPPSGLVSQMSFGCSEDELALRRHPLCRIEGLPRGFEYFFGSPIRLSLARAKARRVAPSSLRILPYHRAVWLLRVVPILPGNRGTFDFDFVQVARSYSAGQELLASNSVSTVWMMNRIRL